MCRIWGVVYGPEGPEGEDWDPVETAQILFPSLVANGPDAYGWMTWNGGEHADLHKFEGRSDTVRAIASMEELDPTAKWIVGHTRWATHGSSSRMLNNHPIHHGNIVGVHNGKIRNYKEILRQTGRQHRETQVDSEAIFAAVHKWGVRPGLLKVEGDMVTVFTDLRKPDTLYIAKSHGRPLVLATSAAGSLYFASEEQALEALGIELHGFTELGNNRLLTVREGKVVSRVQYRTEPVRTRSRSKDSRDVMRQWFEDKKNESVQRVVVTPPPTTRTPAKKPVTSRSAPPGWTGPKPGLVIPRQNERRSYDPVKEEAKLIAAKRGVVDGTPVDGLYYYDGELLTQAEYEAKIEAELLAIEDDER